MCGKTISLVIGRMRRSELTATGLIERLRIKRLGVNPLHLNGNIPAEIEPFRSADCSAD
jgi:hypothetical protein